MKTYPAKILILLSAIFSPFPISLAFGQTPILPNQFGYRCGTALIDNGDSLVPVNLVSFRFRLPFSYRVQALQTKYFFRNREAPLTRQTFFMIPNPLGVNQGEREPVRPAFRYIPDDFVRLEATGTGTKGLSIPFQATTYFMQGERFVSCGNVMR